MESDSAKTLACETVKLSEDLIYRSFYHFYFYFNFTSMHTDTNWGWGVNFLMEQLGTAMIFGTSCVSGVLKLAGNRRSRHDWQPTQLMKWIIETLKPFDVIPVSESRKLLLW